MVRISPPEMFVLWFGFIVAMQEKGGRGIFDLPLAAAGGGGDRSFSK
jgi:hypothetical protein